MVNRGRKGGSSDRYPLFGSKITADSDCSHEIRRCLLLDKKAMTNLDSVLKSGDIFLPIEVCMVKAMVFPVIMCSCESWTIKKAEPRRIDAFEMWCWRRLLRVLWTARRSNQSIFTHWKDWCWSWHSSILVIWCKQLTHWKSPWCWARLRAGEEGIRGWDGWIVSLIQWIWTWANFRWWWGTGMPVVLQSLASRRIGHEWAAE